MRILGQSCCYGYQTIAPIANYPGSDPNVPAERQKATVSELPPWHELDTQDSTSGRQAGWSLCLRGGARTRGHNQVFAEHWGQSCGCGGERSTIYAKLTGVLKKDVLTLIQCNIYAVSSVCIHSKLFSVEHNTVLAKMLTVKVYKIVNTSFDKFAH